MRVWYGALILAGCGFELSVTGDAAPVGDAQVIDGTVVDGPMIDAPLPVDAAIDAAPWTPAMCPASYRQIPGVNSSRYRFKRMGARPRMQVADCADDGMFTHIVALETEAELTAVRNAADADGPWDQVAQHPSQELIWIGGVQTAATTLDGNWIDVFGNPMLDDWAEDEPNDWDQTDGVEDGEEQLAVLWLQEDGIADMVKNFNLGVICECDGKTPATAFTAAWQAATAP